MSLQACHQKSSGYSFPYNVANHQPQLVSAQLQKVVKIPANLESLDAHRRIFQGGKRGTFLRKEPGLYLPRKFELLAITAFGFGPLHVRSALLLHFTRDFRATEKRKRITIHVFEGSRDGAPRLSCWPMMKADATLAPFLELGKDVFGQEDNSRGTADEFVFFRFGSRSY